VGAEGAIIWREGRGTYTLWPRWRAPLRHVSIARASEDCDETLLGPKDSEYRGCQSVTRSGRVCQVWTAMAPHAHTNTPSRRPDAGLGHHNYCRNPDGDTTIWCYTTDPQMRHDFCDPRLTSVSFSMVLQKFDFLKLQEDTLLIEAFERAVASVVAINARHGIISEQVDVRLAGGGSRPDHSYVHPALLKDSIVAEVGVYPMMGTAPENVRDALKAQDSNLVDAVEARLSNVPGMATVKTGPYIRIVDMTLPEARWPTPAPTAAPSPGPTSTPTAVPSAAPTLPFVGIRESLVCGTDCAPPGWRFLELPLQLAVAVWAVLFFIGLGLIVNSMWSDTESKRRRVQLVRARINKTMVYLTTVLSAVQCGLFVVRSLTSQIRDIGFFIECAVCLTYVIDTLLLFWASHLENALAGLGAMFTRVAVDCFLVASVVALALEVDGEQTWFSFSFLGAVHFRQAFKDLMEVRNVNLMSLRAQLMYAVVSTCTSAYVASMAMMSLENLGEPLLLQPYSKDKWNLLSSLYFIVSTVGTVGYGDIVAETTLGRLCAIASIFFGLYACISTMNAVMLVASMNDQGGGVFVPPARCQHVVVVGNPTADMVISFILELFHEDHSEDADDLRAVFMLPRGSTVVPRVNAALKRAPLIDAGPRVTLITGDVLSRVDQQRAGLATAVACFVLPCVMSADPAKEDTENIIRAMAVRRLAKHLRIVLMLRKAEHATLLRDAGMKPGALFACFAEDQFKMELVGKTCQAPGFAPLICNLCKCMGSDPDDEEQKKLPLWQQEYDLGSGNELYEIDLSPSYALRKALFCEVAKDVLELSEGAVYLIGLVEMRPDGAKRVLVNPGPRYAIRHPFEGVQIAGLFIAPDRGAIVQNEPGGVFHGRNQRPADEGKRKGDAPKFQFRSVKKAPADIDDALLATGLRPKQQEKVRELVHLARKYKSALQPTRPPMKMLGRGGHIVVCCIGVQGGASAEYRLGVEHFVRPLRIGYVPVTPPVVVLAPAPPLDWQNTVEYSKVYYLRGTALSLFDLDRANIKSAKAVFIVHAATAVGNFQEAWMADAEVICCTRFVESQLDPEVGTTVITELIADSNHRFIQLPSLMDVREESEDEGVALAIDAEDSSADDDDIKDSPKGKGKVEAVKAKAEPKTPSEECHEYFRQPRYACGQLYVGSVTTSLAANTLYNPSLAQLVSTMISSRVVMLEVTKVWVGKTYFEYFDDLLWSEQLLAVGLYRQGTPTTEPDKMNARRTVRSDGSFGSVSDDSDDDDEERNFLYYVYTAPPGKATILFDTDRVICFGISASIAEEEALDVAASSQFPALFASAEVEPPPAQPAIAA